MSVSGVKRVSCYHVTTEVAMRYAGDATKGNQPAMPLVMGNATQDVWRSRMWRSPVLSTLVLYTVNDPTPSRPPPQLSWELPVGEACTAVA